MLGLINLFVLFSWPFNATVARVIDKVTTDFKATCSVFHTCRKIMMDTTFMFGLKSHW